MLAPGSVNTPPFTFSLNSDKNSPNASSSSMVISPLLVVANESISGFNMRDISSTSFNESLVLTTDERSISNSIYKDKWDELCNLTRYHRTWGDCFGYFLVCTGKAQVMFDINLKPCDILPLIPIILGSGCKIIELRSPYKDIIVCTPEIYDEVIKVF